jgi:hypothetical protein
MLALVCALLCAGLAGYGSAAAVNAGAAHSDSLGTAELAPDTIFDDGVTQSGALYSPLDYGISSSGGAIAAVTGSGSATVFSEPAAGWGSGAPSASTVTVPSSTISSWTYGQQTFVAISPDGRTLYIEFIGTANNSESMLPPGHIYIYSLSGSSWNLTDTLSPGSGYAFASTGLILSGDGSTIVAGGILTTQSSGPGSPGEPYSDLLVFKQVSGSWSGVSTEATETPAFSSVYDDPWEWSVSADGSTIVVETYDGKTAADEDDIVYTDDGTAQISLAASGPAAISGDGSTIAVSEPGGGGGAGFAGVFTRPGATWTASGALAASARLSDGAAGTFGQALALSSNGSAVYLTVDPSAPESGFNRASFNGNGLDTYVRSGATWTTTSAPAYTWTPTTYPSTATADSLNSLVLSADDSTLISLGDDCAGASAGNDDDCTDGMFVFGTGGSSGAGTTVTTATTVSTPMTVSTPTTASTPTTSTQAQTSPSSTPQPSCPQSTSPSTNCTTGLGQPKGDGNTLNVPASCDYVAADGVSCTYNSGAYQVSSAACQSGCSITPAQAESAASAAVQSFMSSIGQGSLGGNALARLPHLPAQKKKGKPFRITHVGSGSVRIPAGGERSLKLELNSAASRQLRRLHKLKVLVLVARTVDGRTTIVLKRNVTFSSLAKRKKLR